MKLSSRAAHAIHCDVSQMARETARLARKHRVAPSTIARHMLLLANPLHREGL